MSETPVNVTPETRTRRPLLIAAVVVAVATLLVWKAGYVGGGGSADHSGSIAAKIGGGATCFATAYEMTNRIAGTKTRLYDCSGTIKGEICVTEQDGVVNDETAAARLLFANTLGVSTPTCAE